MSAILFAGFGISFQAVFADDDFPNDLPDGTGQTETAGNLPAAAGPTQQPWSMPQPHCLQAMGIRTFGWLEQGVTFNSLSPGDRWNGPVATNDRSNDYELNQFWLGFERPVNTHGCGWPSAAGSI